MTTEQALNLALSFLVPFQEAGEIYDTYIEDEGITHQEYAEMLEVLSRFQAEYARKGA